MFAKLAIVIVSVGLCGATLLAYRQARIQMVHELTAARLDAEDAQERGRRLAIQIAARTTPEAVSQAAQALGPMRTPEPAAIAAEMPAWDDAQRPAAAPPSVIDSLPPMPDVEAAR